MSYEDLKQLVIDCEEELQEEFKKILIQSAAVS